MKKTAVQMPQYACGVLYIYDKTAVGIYEREGGRRRGGGGVG
jgi:hypothetical protein